MRKRNQKQIHLMPDRVDHRHAMELGRISWILDDMLIIKAFAWQDLTHKINYLGSPAERMSAGYVVCCGIVKQLKNHSSAPHLGKYYKVVLLR